MRFIRDNVDLKKLDQSVEAINGTSSRLERINTDEVDTLVTLFQPRPPRSRYREAHFKKAPDREKLKQRLENYRLLMWRLLPTDGDNVTGAEIAFVGCLSESSPVALFVLPATEPPNFEELGQLLTPVLGQLLGALFEHIAEKELCIYVGVPVPDELHTILVESGFDPYEEFPGTDPEKETVYIMERATFYAYYAEDYEVGGEH